MAGRRKRRSTTRKLLLSAAALGCAATVAGLGTYGSFTSTTSASAAYTSGTVTIGFDTSSQANRLTVAATNIVPGDTIQRAFDLKNTGNAALASVTLTTSASPSSLLDTDTTNGLQLVIDRCSVAWTEAGPPYTYTCSGSTSTVLASRAVIGSNLALANLSATTAGSADHLRATLSFPSTAGNSLESQSSTITFSFTGTQRNSASQ